MRDTVQLGHDMYSHLLSLSFSLPPSLDHFKSMRARPQCSEFYNTNELIKKLSSIALVLAVDHWVVLRPNCEYSIVQGLWVDTLGTVEKKKPMQC